MKRRINLCIGNDGKIEERTPSTSKYPTHEKEIGQLGYDCRFLVKLVASFQDRVSINYYYKNFKTLIYIFHFYVRILLTFSWNT